MPYSTVAFQCLIFQPHPSSSLSYLLHPIFKNNFRVLIPKHPVLLPKAFYCLILLIHQPASSSFLFFIPHSLFVSQASSSWLTVMLILMPQLPTLSFYLIVLPYLANSSSYLILCLIYILNLSALSACLNLPSLNLASSFCLIIPMTLSSCLNLMHHPLFLFLPHPSTSTLCLIFLHRLFSKSSFLKHPS